MAVVLALLVPAAALAVPTTRFVDVEDTTADTGGVCGGPTNPCQTIQLGIDNAVNGDTVQVAASDVTGTSYNEAVNVNKFVTLRGPKVGVDARGRSSSADPFAEAVVDSPTAADPAFDVTVDGVVIDGFTVVDTLNAALSGVPGIVLNNDSDQVRNTIVRDSTAGVQLKNDFQTVTQNAFYSNNAAGTLSGNGVYSNSAGDASNNGGSTITNNHFQDHTNNAVGLDFTGATTPLYTSTTISGNDSDSDGVGLFLSNLRSPSVVSANTVTNADNQGLTLTGSSDTSIANNKITGAGSDGLRFSAASAVSSTITVTGNTLTGNSGFGVSGAPSSLAPSSSPEVHFNRIFNNSAGGISNDVSNPVIQAANNWFGCNAGPNDGPGDCDTTTPLDVIADPWLVFTVFAFDDTVEVPGSTTIQADFLDNSNGDLPAGADQFPTTNVNSGPDFPLFTITSGPGSLSLTPFVDNNPTVDGVASNTLSSSATGTTTVQASIDNETQSAGVDFVNTPPPPPADSDGDGVPDSSDSCPATPGPASNHGCPVVTPVTPDTDGDGVVDTKDECPGKAGNANNNGCPRVKPRQLTESVTPHRDATAPYKFKVKGTLKRPAGIARVSRVGAGAARAKICTGKVKITVKRGRKTVARRTVRVKSNCKYSKKFRFSARKLPGSGKLKFKASFGGNKALTKRSSKTKTARFG